MLHAMLQHLFLVGERILKCFNCSIVHVNLHLGQRRGVQHVSTETKRTLNNEEVLKSHEMGGLIMKCSSGNTPTSC